MTTSPVRRFAGLIFCALSVGLAPVSRAEDEKIPELKTASGKTYQDVRITKVTPSEISIIHESGVARIPLKDLPDDLKTKFGYDTAKAEAHAKAKSQANAQAEKQMAEAEKKNAEMKALLKAAKPGIFIVDRYAEDKGVVVYGIKLEAFDKISWLQEFDKDNAPAKWNIITTGQGEGNSHWINYDKKYLLIDLPKKENYYENSSVGGMFVKAGSAKMDDGTRIPMFRFVCLGKSEGYGAANTIDR